MMFLALPFMFSRDNCGQCKRHQINPKSVFDFLWKDPSLAQPDNDVIYIINILALECLSVPKNTRSIFINITLVIRHFPCDITYFCFPPALIHRPAFLFV